MSSRAPRAAEERFSLVIVGGGPAAMACARAYRRAGGEGEVALVADEERLPYRRPPLTKELLQGTMAEHELPLEEDDWPARHGVRFVAGRATRLDPCARHVRLMDGRELAYRECVLAPGAVPLRLPVPGADDPGVLVVRSLDHVRDLCARLTGSGPVVVVGAGFIGCEIAASLRRRGHPVALVADQSLPQAARLGDEVARRLHDWLAEDGVQLVLGNPVERIDRQRSGLVVTAGGRTARGGLVVMAAGARPRLDLAGAAGLVLRDGALSADRRMRTPRPGLLAAGDACSAEHALAGRPLRVEHWGDALAQGDVAGRTAAGLDARWEAVPGFWSVIGARTLKHAAWGDGHDRITFAEHDAGSFTARYWRGGQLVGVLTHERDGDYESGREQLARDATAALPGSWSR